MSNGITKGKYKDFSKKLIILLLTILIQLTYLAPGSRLIEQIRAATIHNITFGSQADTFITPSSLNPANGTARRAIPVGTYTDYTIPGAPTFSTSRGLIKFGTINLPPGAIVTSARLRVWHYGTNGGNGSFYIARATSGWSESTIWSGPSYEGDYGGGVMPNYNNNLNAQLREINLNLALINHFRSPNEGIVIRNHNEWSPGFVICSNNIPSGPCHAGMQPQLYIEYIVNQVPNPPEILIPDNNWELGPRTNGILEGVTCDTTGVGLGCDVTFRTSAQDPDDSFPLNNTYHVRGDSGANRDFSTTGEGQIDATRNLIDDRWAWSGQSIDVHGGASAWAPTKYFLVDTTAPSTPVIQAEPEYTVGVQNEIIVNESIDNIVGGVEYYFEVSEDNTFTTILQNSGWISPPITPGSPNTVAYTFGTLTDNTTYYYRVKARDSLWNETVWSNTVESRQDATSPIIQNINTTAQRISPINQDGINDTTEITFEHNDLYPNEVSIDVKDISNNTIYTETHPSTSSGLPLPTPNTNAIPHTFTWNGKDASNNNVADGTYTINITVTDRAGNTTIDNSVTIIVDNTPADISVSTPVTGSWFNTDTITVSGQTEADAVLTVVSAQGGSTSGGSNIVLDAVGLFSEVVQIIEGENSFDLTSTDNTGNTNTVNLKYYREESNPEITNITPDNLINTRQPSINLQIRDTGYDSYISGIDASKTHISIKHSDSDELILVNAGVNVAPSLGNISTTCDGTSNYIVDSTTELTCSYSFVFNSDLAPDGNYTINAQVGDKAGNISQSSVASFELDSNTTNTINTPINGSLFNYSLITITGTAEKGATINISNNHVTDSITFNIDPNQTDPRVTISNCRPSPNPTQDGIKEICDYSVADFQLARDLVNPGNILNVINFITTDVAGNTNTQSININVDVHAVSLSINTDLEFFSPNGDGRQDGVEFIDMASNGLIDTWELAITLASPQPTSPSPSPQGGGIKVFTETGSLPGNLFWDGRDNHEDIVPDGTYAYTLKITTTDGVTFETAPKNVTAVTNIENSVVITYPINNYFTTRGVTNIQGQAPGDSRVRICVDTIGMISGTCDFVYDEIFVDQNGSFSYILPLYRLPSQSVTEHLVTATAYDKYGNVTPDSNIVKISVTNKNPFEEVSILPAYSGVNNPADYQVILDKINNNEEITQADINSLRSVVFRSVVNQGTERVFISYGNLTNLNELPSQLNQNYIGYIDGQNLTRLLQLYNAGSSCSTPTCTWDFFYPVPPVSGGLYEIVFQGKLGPTIQELSAPLTIDGNIPAAPVILSIDKIINGENARTRFVDGKFYSNSNNVLIRGVSDSNANIAVTDQDGNIVCTTTASAIGLWSCEASPFPLPTSSQPSPQGEGVVYDLNTIATVGANTTESIEDSILIIDTVTPEFSSVNLAKEWFRAGDSVEINIVANESLTYSIHKNESANTCINNSILDNSITDFNLSSDRLNSSGVITLSGNSLEGRHCTILEIEDLAGNRSQRELIIKIDNTIPDDITIDTSTWGLFNGVNAFPGLPALGRLTPGFVIKDDSINIFGLSEENSTVQLFVNGALKQEAITNDRNSQTCAEPPDSDIILDTILVKSGFDCLYNFTYIFENGERGYNIQVRAKDFAGNLSSISQSVILYYDKTPPLTPQTMKVSTNGAQIIDWKYAKDQEILASKLGTGNFGQLPITNKDFISIEDWAESLSDTSYSYISPAGELITQQLIQKSGNGVDSRNFAMQKGNGVYTFTSQSWDAPGNASLTHIFQIELDTIAPATPNVQVGMSGLFNIVMTIQGEPGAYSNMGKLSRGGFAGGTVMTLDVNNDSHWERTFTFCSPLTDRAGNISRVACGSVTTPIRPPRNSYECSADIERVISESKNDIKELNNKYLDSRLHSPFGSMISFISEGMSNGPTAYHLCTVQGANCSNEQRNMIVNDFHSSLSKTCSAYTSPDQIAGIVHSEMANQCLANLKPNSPAGFSMSDRDYTYYQFSHDDVKKCDPYGLSGPEVISQIRQENRSMAVNQVYDQCIFKETQNLRSDPFKFLTEAGGGNVANLTEEDILNYMHSLCSGFANDQVNSSQPILEPERVTGNEVMQNVELIKETECSPYIFSVKSCVGQFIVGVGEFVVNGVEGLLEMGAHLFVEVGSSLASIFSGRNQDEVSAEWRNNIQQGIGWDIGTFEESFGKSIGFIGLVAGIIIPAYGVAMFGAMLGAIGLAGGAIALIGGAIVETVIEETINCGTLGCTDGGGLMIGFLFNLAPGYFNERAAIKHVDEIFKKGDEIVDIAGKVIRRSEYLDFVKKATKVNGVKIKDVFEIRSKIVGDIGKIGDDDLLKVIGNVASGGKGFDADSFTKLKSMNNQINIEDYFIISQNKYTELDKIIFINKSDTGKLQWLDEGNVDFGLEHIKMRHVYGYPPHPLKGKATLFSTFDVDDINEGVIKVLNDPTSNKILLENGRIQYQSTVHFRNNTTQIVNVIVAPEGNIITSFPEF